jgi:hypothetical protein
MIFLQVRILYDEDNEDFPPSEDFQASNEDDEEYHSSGDFQSSEDDCAIGGHSFPSDKLKGNNVDDVDFPPSEDFQDIDEDCQGTKQDGENFHSSGDFESSEDDYVNDGHNIDDIFLQMRIFKVPMTMMENFLQVRILMALAVLWMIMIFLQVNIFIEDTMTLERIVIMFLVILIFLA